MPDIEAALSTYLLGISTLTALIDRRLYFDELPDDTDYPAIVCIHVSDVPGHTHNGIVSLRSPNKQYTVYADDKPDAREVADQLEAALSDYTGTISGLHVQYIKLTNEIPGIWKVPPEGIITKNTIDQEYEINYKKE